MDAFWGITGYLPLLLYGFIIYWLFIAVPKRRRARADAKKAAKGIATPPQTFEPALSPNSHQPLVDTIAPPKTDEPSEGYALGIAPNPPNKSAALASAAPISEPVSVILRRQIPPQFDVPARSWIGGLPAMPKGVAWPRSISSEYPERGERPLHFLAQICCADLPKELWGGNGPRQGWLLFFIDPNQGCPQGNDSFHILHIEELGPEHTPPFDLGPVHDGVYTGPNYRHLLSNETVPNSWRRWPVDFVAVPNGARTVEGRVYVTPDNFAAELYPNCEIGEDRAAPPSVRPLTYRQAQYALHSLRKTLERAVPDVVISPAFLSRLEEEGAIETLCAYCTQQAKKLQKDQKVLIEQGAVDVDPAIHLEKLQWHAARIAHFEGQAAWLTEIGDADGIVRYLKDSPSVERAWQDRMLKQVDSVMTALQESDSDTILSQSDWLELVDCCSGRDFVRWLADKKHLPSDGPNLVFREFKRSSQLNPPAGMLEFLADMYLDPEQNVSIPDDIRKLCEAHWRQLYDNRPHRMGGYHDGVQSEAMTEEGNEVLMLQIATDDAMNWCWGDAGAYYFWIRSEHLAALDFSGVDMILECH